MGVAEGWNGIQQLGAVEPELMLQIVREHAVLVAGDRHDIGAVGTQHLKRGQIGRRFDENGVAGVKQHSAQQVD